MRRGHRIYVQKNKDLQYDDYSKLLIQLQYLVQKDESIIEVYLNSKGGHAHSDFFSVCSFIEEQRSKRIMRMVATGDETSSAAAMFFVIGTCGERFFLKKTSKILFHGPNFYFFPIGRLYQDGNKLLQFSEEESVVLIREIEFYLRVLNEYTSIPRPECLKSLEGKDLVYSGQSALNLKVADGYL